jgi:hypothetical protein
MPRNRTTYRRDEFEEFEGKLRRFNESLAHRERRMLRTIIAAALEDSDDTAGFMDLSDDELFAALARLLTAEGGTGTVS